MPNTLFHLLIVGTGLGGLARAPRRSGVGSAVEPDESPFERPQGDRSEQTMLARGPVGRREAAAVGRQRMAQAPLTA